MSEAETPQTDTLFTEWQKHWKHEEEWGGISHKPTCWWEHARNLERELVEKDELIAKLKKALRNSHVVSIK